MYTTSHPHTLTPSHPHILNTHTEANILRDMSECRAAINEDKWAELASTVHGIAAKSRRVAEVARAQLGGVASPALKRSLEASIVRLEKGGCGRCMVGGQVGVAGA